MIGLGFGGIGRSLMAPFICIAIVAGCAIFYIVLSNAREAGASRVEAQRLADAAAATAETLERTEASVTALQRGQAESRVRIRDAEGQAGDLRRRLGEAEAAQYEAELAAQLAADKPAPSWEGRPCPSQCIVPVPVEWR